MCPSLSLLTDAWLFLPYSPNTSLTPREARVSLLVMMWYVPLLFVSFSVCFHYFPIPCTYVFSGVLLLAFLFLMQVEVPPPTMSGTLVEEVIIAPSAIPKGWKRSPLVVV